MVLKAIMGFASRHIEKCFWALIKKRKMFLGIYFEQITTKAFGYLSEAGPCTFHAFFAQMTKANASEESAYY